MPPFGFFLEQPGAFNYDVGLKEAKEPSKKVAKLVRSMLECADDAEIHVSLHGRFSKYGIVKKGDVVLLKADGNNYLAGKLLLIACVSGVNLVMLETWTLRSSDLSAGFQSGAQRMQLSCLLHLRTF